MPKIHIKIAVLLWAVLALAIVLEVAVLYKYLYQNPHEAGSTIVANEAESVRVNLPVYENVAAWLKDNAAYQTPVYQLEKETTGRENPFAEYR